MDGFDKPLYTSDAILSAAKLLRERIVELEAEISRLHSESVPASFKELGKRLAARLDEDDWGYIEPFLLECERGYTAHTTDERDELRQQNAELTKQRDGLTEAVQKFWLFGFSCGMTS